MQAVKACRTCLMTDVKLYSMYDSFIYNAYLQLTGLIKFESPDHICFECASLLKKFEDFRSKCMKAHTLLSGFIQDNIELTQDIIRSVNRKENKLESSLRISETKTVNFYPELNRTGDCSDNEEMLSLDIVKMEGNAIDSSHKNSEAYKYHQIDPSEFTDNKHMILVSSANIEDNISLEKPQTRNCKNVLKNSKLKVSKPDKNKKVKPKTKMKKIKNKSEARNKRKIKMEVSSTDDDMDTSAIEYKNKVNKPSKITKNDAIKKRSRPSLDESFFEGYATIVLLTPEQAKKEVLQRKDSSNYINCQYKCDLCYRGFEAQSTYENHMKKHSPESGPHECAYCHMRFPGLSVLCRHRQSCHKRKFYCQICPYTCFCSHQAKIHVNLHKGKKYPCKECGEVFSMPNSLLMHKRIKHATECVCDLCGSTFTNERGLRSHKKMLHRQETNARHGPSCEQCGVQFASDVAWKRHLVLSSKHGVSNGCETCGETFPDSLTLKEHARTHTRRRHASATATAVCVCEVCGKTFKELCFLVLHQRTHTGERPFRCEDCGKAFPSPAALTSHRDTHTTSACYRCQLCTKQFTFRSSLYRHMKISHLGFRPHKCSMCEKTFPTPCQVRLHTKYVHHKVPWPKRERRRQPSQPNQEVGYVYDN